MMSINAAIRSVIKIPKVIVENDSEGTIKSILDQNQERKLIRNLVEDKLLLDIRYCRILYFMVVIGKANKLTDRLTKKSNYLFPRGIILTNSSNNFSKSKKTIYEKSHILYFLFTSQYG